MGQLESFVKITKIENILAISSFHYFDSNKFF